MPERPAQVALGHQMLDAMLDGSIALCDAGAGIGKTYAYLVAGMAFSRFRTASGMALRPILISTSSIALQNAVRDEYLPLLSDLLTADGMITEPLQAVIRKGKSHYVCDERLEQRLEQIMTVIGRQIYKLLTRPTQKLLARVYASTAMFNGSWPNMVFYTLLQHQEGG